MATGRVRDNGRHGAVDLRRLSHPIVFRDLEEADWPQILALAKLFYAEKPIPGNLSEDAFRKNWTAYIAAGFARILVAEVNGEILGSIGGFYTPDPSSNDLVCSEAWWFVRPDSRTIGIRILKRWIEEARNAGCRRLTMVHLSDFSSQRIGAVYRRLGLQPLEQHYWMNL